MTNFFKAAGFPAGLAGVWTTAARSLFSLAADPDL
jgi:hypothetical protein